MFLKHQHVIIFNLLTVLCNVQYSRSLMFKLEFVTSGFGSGFMILYGFGSDQIIWIQPTLSAGIAGSRY